MKKACIIGIAVWLEMLRRKDIYVFLILLVAAVFAMFSSDAFGVEGASGHIKEIGLLLAWLFSAIISVQVAARQLPREESTGTIYMLLAKPLTRWELILGKWLGAWTIVSAAVAGYYAVVAAAAKAGGGGFDPATFTQALLLHAEALSIITAVALALSTRMTAGAAAAITYILAFASYGLTGKIPRILAVETGARADLLLVLYYALPHLELFDMRRRLVHGWGPAPAPAVLTVTAYAALLTAAFLILAWLGYRTKRFSRGVQI